MGDGSLWSGAGGLSFRRMGALWPGVRCSPLWVMEVSGRHPFRRLVVFWLGAGGLPFRRMGYTTWFVRGRWSGLLYTWVGILWQGTLPWGGSCGKEIMDLTLGRPFLDDWSIMGMKHLAAGILRGGSLSRDCSFEVGTIAWRLRGFSRSRGVPLLPGWVRDLGYARIDCPGDCVPQGCHLTAGAGVRSPDECFTFQGNTELGVWREPDCPGILYFEDLQAFRWLLMRYREGSCAGMLL